MAIQEITKESSMPNLTNQIITKSKKICMFFVYFQKKKMLNFLYNKIWIFLPKIHAKMLDACFNPNCIFYNYSSRNMQTSNSYT